MMTTGVDNIFSDFQSRYQFRILGNSDMTYEHIARSLGDNSFTIDRLKSQRAAMTIEISALRNSADLDQGTMSQRIALRETTFIRSAVNALRDISNDGNLTYMRMAVNALTQDLQRSINTYLSSDTRTAEEDEMFRNNAQLVMERLSQINTTLRGRTSSDAGPGFDINVYQASRRLTDLRALLSNFPPATPPAPPGEENNETGGIDITV